MVEIGIAIIGILLAILRKQWGLLFLIAGWIAPIAGLATIFMLFDASTIKLVFLLKFSIWLVIIFLCCYIRDFRSFAIIITLGMSLFAFAQEGWSKTSSLPFFLAFVAAIHWPRFKQTRVFWLLGAVIEGVFLGLRGHIGVALATLSKPLFRLNIGLNAFWLLVIGSSLLIGFHLFLYYEIFYNGSVALSTASNAERSAMFFYSLPQDYRSVFLGGDFQSFQYNLQAEYNFSYAGWSDGTLETDVHNFFGHFLKYGGLVPLLVFLVLAYKMLAKGVAKPVDIQLLIILVYFLGFHPFTSFARMIIAIIIGVLVSHSSQRLSNTRPSRNSISSDGSFHP